MLCTEIVLAFRTIFVHNMFSPCSVKRRASDKDLPVQLEYYRVKHGVKKNILCIAEHGSSTDVYFFLHGD